MTRFRNLAWLPAGLWAAALLVLGSCVHDPVIPEGWVPPPPPPDTPGVDRPCDPDSVYFANTILPLLNSNCGIPGCHDPATASDGVVLTDYNSIINTADVRPGNPGGSDLYEVITEDDPDKIMPPPGSGLSPLTPEQIMDIFTWINQGAPNNACDAECDTSNVTFSGSVWPLLQASCTGCHSGSAPQGGVRLDGYDEIAVYAANGLLANVLTGAGGATPMPFNQPPLSECRQRIIQIWIQDGYPDN
jgi:hypothetical protein